EAGELQQTARRGSSQLSLMVAAGQSPAALPHAATLKSPICASSARLKAGREVQRATYSARRLSLETMSVCFRMRSTVVIMRSPAVNRSPSRKGLSPSDLDSAEKRLA